MKIFTYLEIGLWSFLGIAASLSMLTNIILLDVLSLSCFVTLTLFKILVNTSNSSNESTQNKESFSLLKNTNTYVIDSVVCNEGSLDLDSFFDDYQKVILHLKLSKDYLSITYTLSDLEADINLPKKRISEVIRFNTGGNFYRLVAKLRINHAKMLIDTNFPYSFEHLSSEVGFASRSTFNKYFKDFEGVTPKEYKLKIN